jgi:hypothetical protein
MASISPGYNVPRAVVEDYIKRVFQQHGHDPNIASRVFRSEGAPNWHSQVRVGDGKEQSFGPFQLYTGGGEGNRFQQKTGLDPRDPNPWPQQVEYVAQRVKETGWKPWNGAKASGIGPWDGVNTGQQTAPPQIPGSAPVLPSEGFTPGPTNAPVPMPGSPAATPPPAMPSQPRPPGLMDGMSQLAQLFGGQQQQAAAAPPMPQQQGHGINPIAIQAIAQMMKNPSYGKGALAHRFYSRGQA